MMVVLIVLAATATVVAASAAIEDRFADVNGVRLRCLAAGEGRAYRTLYVASRPAD